MCGKISRRSKVAKQLKIVEVLSKLLYKIANKQISYKISTHQANQTILQRMKNEILSEQTNEPKTGALFIWPETWKNINQLVFIPRPFPIF